MTLLHVYFLLRDQQAFQRLLDLGNERGKASASVTSTSGKKSWSRSSTLAMACDVNARDELGRTALHLACASLESIEYVRLLLRHPAINVNLADRESHWTPFHRALYHANLPAAVLLLQRSDLDSSLKDLEGYTAFDLYNSTLNGTKPSASDVRAELFTWGANRNAALGLGDGGDRTHPDQVVIQKDDSVQSSSKPLAARFSPTHVKKIQMSKLHTAVVTSESKGNLRVCGFGNGGRLGQAQHTQYGFRPLPQFAYTIVSVALGQDHTLALTDSGEVLTWGLNRFSQLGYIVEAAFGGSSTSKLEEPIQPTPRKVHGALKKEFVRGVAASKQASACWTSTEVYTWGTNSGQLGYDKTTQPIQILPRKVTKVTQPILALSITDTAMACLLDTQDVVCFWNDRHFKINFPTHVFPSEMQPYRPPQAVKDAFISKITSCDDTFAALSSNGELFTFLPNLWDTESTSGKDKKFQPQRVWALRKKFSAVKDVALGSDGSIIICTESGHVFVRSRNAKGGQSASGKTFKFQRVPYIQRVTQVCANSTGAFGAVRMDFSPTPIEVYGNTISQDLARIQPYLSIHSGRGIGEHQRWSRLSKQSPTPAPPVFNDDELDDIGIESDIKSLSMLCDAFVNEKGSRQASSHETQTNARLPHGADIMVQTQSGALFPAHRVILAARCSVLRDVLSGLDGIQDQGTNISLRLSKGASKPARLNFTGCQAISVLILLEYLYSDELIAIWDRRVSTSVEAQLRSLKIKPAQVKLDLQTFSRILDLPLLAQALESPSKRVPVPSMARNMGVLFQDTLDWDVSASEPTRRFPLAPDVILQLADKNVLCHSAVLRARSVFFACFFDEEDWTVKRWDAKGMITVDMKHLRWHVMEYVLRFMCCGEDKEMFDVLDFATSIDDVLEFMFDVMAAANELLLDRLVLLCSAVILDYSNIHNACYILADATHFHAQQLIESIQGYMTANMETLLESRMLDEIPAPLIKQLALFAQRQQVEKAPISRSDHLVSKALKKHRDWLALQDIPEPSFLLNRTTRDSPKRSTRHFGTSSLQNSPTLRPQPHSRSTPSGDDIFAMDDADVPSSLTLDQPSFSPQISGNVTSSSLPAWKASSTPRVDMKAIMAETANSSTLSRTPESSLGILKFGQRTPQKSYAPPEVPQSSTGAGLSRQSGSPWRSSLEQASSPITPSQSIPPSNLTRSKESQFPSLGSKASIPSTPPRSSAPQPGLGPMITPTRQPTSKPSSSNLRRTSGPAWTLPPPPPALPVTRASPPASGMSFVAIQQLQLDQVVEPGRDRRSLREIQNEERARQAEEDFLKWWTAEEARLKAEADAELAALSASTKPSRKSRPSKGKGGSQSTSTQTTQDNPVHSARAPQAGRGRKTPKQKAPAAV